MARPTRLLLAVLVAAGTLLTGCSLPFGGADTGDQAGGTAVSRPSTGPQSSPTTPADYVPPPSAPAQVTGTDRPGQPTGSARVDAAGPFCDTAKRSIKAWGGNLLVKLQEFARSPDSGAQLKAYLVQAAADATALSATAPPQIKNDVTAVTDAVTRLNLELSASGYDLSKPGVMISATKVATDLAVVAAWARLTEFVQNQCGVDL
jgi:predicted small secreted protein